MKHTHDMGERERNLIGVGNNRGREKKERFVVN